MPRYSRDSAFLNIPYDPQYTNLYFAFIAGSCAFGLEPRATLQLATGERRLDRIFGLMTSCHTRFTIYRAFSSTARRRARRDLTPRASGQRPG